MSTSTSTVIQEPWTGQQSYLTDTFKQADKLYDQGPLEYYDGQLIAPFSDETNQALGMYTDLATAGSPSIGALDTLMTDTLSGQYLDPATNPYLNDTYDYAADAVTRNYNEATAPSIGAQFDSAGRYGSGLYSANLDTSQDTLARNLGGLASDIYGGNYSDERTNQLNAASIAPSTIPMNYYDAGQLLNVGSVYDQQNQNVINADMNKFNFEQSSPWDTLGRYSSVIGGNYGTNETTTQPLYENDTRYGSGLLGAQVGYDIGGGYGAAIGGLGGFLFG